MRIKDINLAEEGKRKIEWASNFMPILNTIKKDFENRKPFENVKIGMCLHLEAKTAFLAETLKAGTIYAQHL